MLITKMKPIDDILNMIGNKIIVICCEGCREVYYPENQAIAVFNRLRINGADLSIVDIVYACNKEHLSLSLKKYSDDISSADDVFVVSCGVGVQTISEFLFESNHDINVRAICDTYPLPGFQGITPLEYDCALCGDCHLNKTGGICPITSCSKSLTNGQCGGAKDGKCEVDQNLDCGWQRIAEKLGVRSVGRGILDAPQTV